MRFLEVDEIIEINKLTTAEQGGLHGLRDKHLLESAIANPQNLHHYQSSDIYTIASSYAISIIKNHPFLDGNKRTGFLSMDLFLRMNDKKIKFSQKDTVDIMVKVATSEVGIEELSVWLKRL
jgi:death-on-curing protein